MQRNLDEAKGVLDMAAITKPFNNEEKTTSLFDSIQNSNELSFVQGKKGYTEAGVLYQPSISRSQSKLPKAREDRVHPSHSLQKTPPLLLGTSHSRHDRPTDKKDNEQDKRSMAPRPMDLKA